MKGNGGAALVSGRARSSVPEAGVKVNHDILDPRPKPLSPDPFRRPVRQAASRNLGQSQGEPMNPRTFALFLIPLLAISSLAATPVTPLAPASLPDPARVAAIDEDLAANPPPLTVDFKDASLQEVADALSKVLNQKVECDPPNRNDPAVRFTLSARDKPFWEVFMDLSRQHGLSLQGPGGSLRLITQRGVPWRNGAVAGPVAFFPTMISLQRYANQQSTPGELTQSMSLQYSVVFDPRLRLVKFSIPAFTDIIDDAGNNLFHQEAKVAPLSDVNSRNLWVVTDNVSLRTPEKRGTRIVSAKGSVRFAVQVGEEHIDITDLEKKLGQPCDIADITVRVARLSFQFEKTFAGMSMTLDASRVPPPQPGEPNVLETSKVTAILLDATGKVAFTGTVRHGLAINASGAYTLPFKLRLSAPSKVKDITLPFELKDLPLP